MTLADEGGHERARRFGGSRWAQGPWRDPPPAADRSTRGALDADILVLPGIYLMSVAFMTNGPYGQPQMPLTLDAFERLAGYGILGWSPANLYTLLRSLAQTLVATLLVVAISYPLAYHISTAKARWRPMMLLALVVPSWTNQVIRTFGWMNLLAPGTPLAGLAESLNLIPSNMGLYPSNIAVTLGLVYNFLPFMVLPLYAAFEKLDISQVEGGAGPLRFATAHLLGMRSSPRLCLGCWPASCWWRFPPSACTSSRSCWAGASTCCSVTWWRGSSAGAPTGRWVPPARS